MHNLTDFLFYTGVNGVISYTNRFSEHNIDIGVISNDSLCRIYNMYKAAKFKQYASEKWSLCFYTTCLKEFITQGYLVGNINWLFLPFL